MRANISRTFCIRVVGRKPDPMLLIVGISPSININVTKISLYTNIIVNGNKLNYVICSAVGAQVHFNLYTVDKGTDYKIFNLYSLKRCNLVEDNCKYPGATNTELIQSIKANSKFKDL